MKTFSVIALLCLLGIGVDFDAKAQLVSHDFESLDSLLSVEERKVVVFIETDWCKFCQQMKNTTFQNEEVVTSLNSNFYFVRLNGESKDDITFSGHTFKYKPNGATTGVHELAEELGTIEGKLNFPTLSVLNAQNEIVFQHGGLLETDALLAVLRELISN